MPLIICTRCSGIGKVKRKDGFTVRCDSCKGVGKREHPPRKTSASPWGTTPMAITRNALRNWDWVGAARKIAEVNKVRIRKGAPPLPTPLKEPKP